MRYVTKKDWHENIKTAAEWDDALTNHLPASMTAEMLISRIGEPVLGRGGAVHGWTKPAKRGPDDGPVIDRKGVLGGARAFASGAELAELCATYPGTDDGPIVEAGQDWRENYADGTATFWRVLKADEDGATIYNIGNKACLQVSLVGQRWIKSADRMTLVEHAPAIRQPNVETGQVWDHSERGRWLVTGPPFDDDGERVVPIERPDGALSETTKMRINVAGQPDTKSGRWTLVSAAPITPNEDDTIRQIIERTVAELWQTQSNYVHVGIDHAAGHGETAVTTMTEKDGRWVVHLPGGSKAPWPLPRCGQTWVASDGLEGVIFDENPPRQYHLRMSTAERIIVHASTFLALTFIEGPTVAETPREAFERVVRLEAADVPSGFSYDRWLGELINAGECGERIGKTGDEAEDVRRWAATVRREHAAYWREWSSDRVGDPRAGR